MITLCAMFANATVLDRIDGRYHRLLRANEPPERHGELCRFCGRRRTHEGFYIKRTRVSSSGQVCPAMQALALFVQFALAICVSATVPLPNIERKTSFPIVPNKFIVEFDTAADIPGKRSGEAPHTHILRSWTERGVGFHVGHKYNAPGLFVGAAITLNNTYDVKQLGQTSGVLAIRPSFTYQAPKPVFSHVITSPSDPAVPPETQSTHILTGVDKLHAQGIFGTGVNIGIIDTGIDYTHPALGGAIGPGHKIVGGYDFVGDNYTGGNTPVPDDDPLDQCNGHGTHVAGILGADPDNPFNISGVAYEASIRAYRIFGCTGDVTDDIIVAALLLGRSDKQDVLTLSLGGADGWTESTSSVVASRLAATGTVVTIAAGNDGATGSWFTSGPGNGVDVISVASLDNTVIQLQNATVHGVANPGIPYYDLWPLPIPGEWPIYATSNDTTIIDDACDPLPDSTPDLSGFLTVVRRGTCTFVQKLTNIADKGGNVALIYDNGNGFVPIDTGTFTNATLIQAADGIWLVSQFIAGAPITISFPQSGGSFGFPDPSGGLISSFTSYGPTNDMYFKPAVAAPGGNILSTLPVPLGSYAVMSGTSMATPFLAGSAALLLGVKGKTTAVALAARSLFETTAQTIGSDHTDVAPLQTATQQGAGLVDVFTAIHTETLVTPGQLVLNDTANYKGFQSFTVVNVGKTVKNYTLNHSPAGTALTYQPGTIFPADGPVPLSTNYATVKLSATSLTLHPGQSSIISAHITPPSGDDPSTFPVFSGFIKIQSETETTHVTYLGLKGSLKDVQVVDNTSATFGFDIPALIDAAGDVQTGPQNYTLLGSDVPLGLSRLAFGTAILRYDLVQPDISLVPTLDPRSLKDGNPVLERNLFSFPHGKPNTFAQVSIVGSLFEIDYIPRDPENGYHTLQFSAQFANGTDIPTGNYRILLRTLTVTGDSTQEKDFESWLSPIIGVFPNGTSDSA
ncbi:subtilisin-like protease [Auriscalpium vulgare]|uniref:Subtilisin-like protease n=1 Tax=Auriscalpium vulgare TaxID=40419 RepID=A0ACB8S207_9AGAM|nr:subtilisin-like protease [Auriscalpium vulgare]